MASIIRIKRSSVSGNPSTLAAGELAYSALSDNGSNGGDRLYIGIGTETGGNAANHLVIGGTYFTDKLDHTAGVLTASSALIVDASKKLDELLVDNLSLNGSTLSTTNTNGDLTIAPNGTGKTIVSNLFIGDSATSIQEYIQDQTGGSLVEGFGIDLVYNDTAGTTTISAELASSSNAGVASFNATDFTVAGTGENAVTLNVERIQDIVGDMVSTNVETGIAVSYDDTNGKLDFNVNDPLITIAGDVDGSATMTNLGDTTITVALDTVNSNVGQFGSSSSIPVLTVDGKGRVTAVSTAAISSSFTLAANTGVSDTFNTGETLTFTGTAPVTTAVSNNTITIGVSDATTSAKGVASFASTDFSVASGAVSLAGTVVKSISTDSGALTPTGNTLSIVGGEGIDVTHSGTTITVAGELATTTNIGVASFTSASFAVSTGEVSIKAGGVSNSQLVNSSVTIGTTAVSLGSTAGALAGITELTVDNLNFNGNSITSTDTNGNIVISPNGTGTVDIANSRITGVAEPVNATDAATKNYVDTVAEGLHIHEAARVATTDTLAVLSGGTVTYANGTAGVGATLTLSLGLTALDGITLANGDRILVKDQATQAHNGMYVRTSATVLTRASDFDTSAEMAGGDFTFVESGTLFGASGFVCTFEVLVVGTDPVIWQQFSGAGTFNAGAGLTNSGTTFNVGAGLGITVNADDVALASTVAGDGLTYTSGVLAVGGTSNRISVTADAIDIASTYVGQTSITTLGTVATGTWNATTIGTTKGGTGLTSYVAGDLIYGSGVNTLAKLTKPTSATSLLTMDSAGAPAWAALSATGITGVGTLTSGTWNATAIGPVYGGTGLTSYSTGDLIYASAPNTLSKRTAGTEGQLLQMNASGVPVWGDIDGGTY